jgi:hypothetical protein
MRRGMTRLFHATRWTTRLRLTILVAVGTALAAATSDPLPAQQATPGDTLRGVVRGADTVLIGNAQITVTPGGSGATQSVVTRSNVAGRWSVVMPARSPSYFVTISAIGWIQQRVTALSNPTGAVVVNASLKKSPVVLNTVKIVEQRRQPATRDFLIGTDVAQTEKGVFGSSEVFGVADKGDLVGMIAQVPGVQIIADPNGVPSFSVLGLSSAQNNVTLNGLAFGGGEVPRDIGGAVRVTSSSYDVSRGGFSGAQLSVTQGSGGNFRGQLAHITVDGPGLQATDQVGRSLGQQYSNVVLSGLATGPLQLDRLFYNVSAQGGRRQSDLRSLINSDAFSLERIGVAEDSVTAFMQAAQLLGIPLSKAGVPSDRQTTSGSVLGRLDWTPSNAAVGNLVASVRHSDNVASFVGPTAVPGHGGEVIRSGGDVTGEFSGFIHKTILNDTRIGAHADATDVTPYLALPDARVLVTSQFPGNVTGLSSLVAGGNSSLLRSSRVSGAEVLNQTSWNSVSNRHSYRLTLDGRLDALTQTQAGNTLGTFTYASLDDFRLNRPRSFTRSFVSGDIAPRVETGSAALGDFWRASDRLSLQYGLRLDANRVATAPAYNPGIDSIFGLRTDFAPREALVSPRVGFSYGFGDNGTTGIPGFGAPWGFLSGGVGEFRNDIRPGLIAPALANTGLPNGIQQITCIGSAVPTPDFQNYVTSVDSIPTACAAGAAPELSNALPNVTTIAPGFQSQRSWRGNLALRGPFVTKLFRFSADAVYSLNQHQQSPVDVNFAPVQRGAISTEGNRPLYVNPGSIVPTSGAMNFTDSRLSPRFGGVTEVKSDLESISRQFTFTLNPIGIGTQAIRWNTSYVLSGLRDQQRGFGANTAGNPLDVQWGRAAQDARHQVNFNVYFRVSGLFSVAATGRASSGLPFTPIVAGDINGDGLSNDRAFIFAPQTADSAVKAGMSSLLASASPRVRNCLLRQTGAVAGRNSCEGPWTTTWVAAINLNPAKLGMSNRSSVTLNLSNPVAGIDQLLHGSHLQGWGQPAAPDPTLLRVRGYDAAAGAFKYEVNQRFGDTRLSTSGVRVPFVMTLEVRIQLGQDFERQRVDQLLGPGRNRRGPRLTLPQMRNRLTNSVFNPLRGILDVKDSLSILSQAQVDKMTQVQRRLVARQDSVWGPLATYLTSLPDAYDAHDVLVRIHDGQVAAFDAMLDAMTELSKVLTPEQIADFPPVLRSFFDLNVVRQNRPVYGFFPGY